MPHFDFTPADNAHRVHCILFSLLLFSFFAYLLKLCCFLRRRLGVTVVALHMQAFQPVKLQHPIATCFILSA